MFISMGMTFPRKYIVTRTGEEFEYTFYCDGGDYGYTTRSYSGVNAEETLKKAWQEARSYFNRCHECGAWVCDQHYNEDVMKCTMCNPKNP